GGVPFSKIRTAKWPINGVEQPKTLQELIDEATQVLDPHQQQRTSIGHGDAHYGNVFLADGKFVYYDPAFAWRHSPLLDVVKPLVLDTLLQPWLYFPEDVDVTVTQKNDNISVNYAPYGTPFRKKIYDVKQQHLVQPLLAWLEEEGALP